MTLAASSLDLDAVHEAVRSVLARSVTPSAFREQAAALSLAERNVLVEQALVLLENFYVHLPFKRAMHAVDPVQRLKLLRQHLSRYRDDDAFHAEMSNIFLSLRDLHTNYLLPAPYNNSVATLPFRVAACVEANQTQYIVGAVSTGFHHPTFVPGVEIRHWNGVPINRAVEIAAAHHAGSNPEARHSRGLAALTQRPLIVLPAPDEEWIIVRYRSVDGIEHPIRFDWRVISLPEPKSVPSRARQAELGIDLETELVQRTQRLLFSPEVEATVRRVASIPYPLDAVRGLESTMPEVFTAREVQTKHGKFGYIRIWSFLAPSDSESFVNEFIRLAGLLPQNGMILDIRDNGGGYITASEQLLQVLTPRTIEPERAQFINTQMTLRMCELHSPSSTVDDFDLSNWLPSLRRSIETGAVFSGSFPLSSPEKCNDVGQRYYGPVVLITSARCYSATDMFAAGFQDHNVGPILGVDGNTGAGGANVWDHSLLQYLFMNPEHPDEALPDSPFRPLPREANLRAAIRRTTRVGQQAGVELEDLGVVPEHRHALTKADVLNGDVDLLDSAARLLLSQVTSGLRVNVKANSTKKVAVQVHYENLDRLDLFVESRPLRSKLLKRPKGVVKFNLVLARPSTLLVQGFSHDQLAAVRRISIA